MHPKWTLAVVAILLAAAPGLALTQTASSPVSGALPGNDIGTHSSLPRSAQAANITPEDTHSPIAPTAPEPAVSPDANVRQLLVAGQRALSNGQTDTADEALEQAESRILTRSVPQTQTDYASSNPLVAEIEQARVALGNHDKARASQLLGQMLASNAPELMD